VIVFAVAFDKLFRDEDQVGMEGINDVPPLANVCIF